MRERLLAAVLLASTAACSLYVDTSGLAGPAKDAGGDGSGNGSGDGSVVYSTDAAPRDSGPPGFPGFDGGGRNRPPGVDCAGGAFSCTAPESECCVIYGTEVDYCIAPGSACTSQAGDPTAVIACQDESICPSGQVCCATLGNANTPLLGASCAPSCGGGKAQMCRPTRTVCPGGTTCQHIPAYDNFEPGNSYRLCQ